MPNPDLISGYPDESDKSDNFTSLLFLLFILFSILYYGYHIVTKTPIQSPCPYYDSSGELRDDC